MARTGTNRDYRLRNAKLEHTLSHWTAQASTRIIELENRCTGMFRPVFETAPHIPPKWASLRLWRNGALRIRYG